MKILTGKREDILRRKAEYENKLKTYELAEEGARRAYRTVEHNALQPIDKELHDNLSKFNLLNFDIVVRRGWEGPEVRIRCEDNSTLRWSYEVDFDSNNEIRNATNSWSGMNATTVDDIAILRQTADALEYLISIDWKALLDVKLPDYNTYWGNLPEQPERENFSDSLAEATLEEVMGQNNAILVEPFNDYYSEVWIKVLKATNKFFVIAVGPSNLRTTSEDDVRNYDFSPSYLVERVKKDKLRPVEPVEIVDLG